MKALVVTDTPKLDPVASAKTVAAEQHNRLRVLHVVNRYETGGTEHGVLKIVNGLDSRFFEHRICVARGYIPEVADAHGLRGRIFVAGNAEPGFQWLVFRLRRIMRAYRPHIVHSRNWGAIEAIAAARLARVPVVVHSEHGYELDMLEGLPWRRRLLRRGLYSLADAVFTVTRELRDYHASQASVQSERLRVIYNGVDTRRFSPDPAARQEARRKFGLPPESFLIGTVGRLVPIKDHAALLRAAEILGTKGVDVRVVIAGTGPEETRLRQLADTTPTLAGRVHFLGACENVEEVLRSLDVFVLPSVSEGMSNTLLEAMASGLPVVATRVGGNPEIVEDGVSGLLCPAGDATELARLIDRLVNRPELRHSLGVAARQSVTSKFSLEKMISDYRDLYLELAHRRGLSLAGAR
jgi:sugar transferase (PEP-CTERM/EpsH1 system associated)